MQGIQALINCGANSSRLTPRHFDQLGISHQMAHITTRALTRSLMQHAKDSQKTRITVKWLEYLALVDISNLLFVQLRVYDLLLGLPWFPKKNLNIVWARLTPWYHGVRVEWRNDTDDYGNVIEGLPS
jgi:hypothetical protein